MFSNISKNGAGIIILFLSLLGIEVAESEVINFLSAISTVVSFFLMVWNQLERRDTRFFIFKK